MPPPRAAVTSETPAAPVLVSLYTDAGLAGRIELSPRSALHLAADLLNHVIAKERATAMNASAWETIARSASWIRDEIEGPLGSFQDRGVRSELTVILDHLTCCRPDDLPARAVRALVDACLEAGRSEDGALDAMFDAAMAKDD
jgi:hypothetical protein